jgi:hypothetical protein
MAMTKKDYELIAEGIRVSRYGNIASDTPEFQHGIDRVVVNLAFRFGMANPRFDTKKFYAACLVGKLPKFGEVA